MFIFRPYLSCASFMMLVRQRLYEVGV